MSADLADIPPELAIAVATTLEAAGVSDGHLSLELVDEERIRELNREHRGRDEPTDVLSFPIDGPGPSAGPRELGDVLICPEQTADLAEAAVHGVLHLCGYDHEDDGGEMLALQARILADVRGGPPVDDAGIEIRPARIAEADAILGCYEWLFAPPGSRPEGWNPDRAKAALIDAIDSDAATVLVADGGGPVVGLCTAYLDLLSVRFGLRCWVEDLAVDPDRRSRGVGAALLAAARTWAADRGASHLELDSAPARIAAHRFYEREGARSPSLCFGWHGIDRGR